MRATGPRSPDPEIDAIIGANLKRFRIKLRWSQQALGDEIGVSFQQIQKYEKGNNRIAASTLYKASKIMNVRLIDFYQGLDAGTGKPAPLLSREEADVLRLFRKIPSEEFRRSIRKMMKSISSREPGGPESLAN